MTEEEKRDEINWASASVNLLSPKKMLVESATMIYIIAFMLLGLTIMIWKGDEMGTGQIMGFMFGLLFTMTVAVRQYSSFRY
tara:strand:- start:16 stop:261 length:246 start_codon:yes stop_codon:yes gene_type:complete